MNPDPTTTTPVTPAVTGTPQTAPSSFEAPAAPAVGSTSLAGVAVSSVVAEPAAAPVASAVEPVVTSQVTPAAAPAKTSLLDTIKGLFGGKKKDVTPVAANTAPVVAAAPLETPIAPAEPQVTHAATLPPVDESVNTNLVTPSPAPAAYPAAPSAPVAPSAATGPGPVPPASTPGL